MNREEQTRVEEAVLAVDIGTTALKAALITRSGKVLSYSKQPLQQDAMQSAAGKEGAGSHKEALGWMRALKKAVEELQSTHSAPRDSKSRLFLPHTKLEATAQEGGAWTEEDSGAAKDSGAWELEERTNIAEGEHLPFSLRAISISGNGPTLVSQDGTTLLWNAPSAPSAQITTSSIFVPRIAAFAHMFKAVWNTLDGDKMLFSGPEYLAYCLTGKAVTVLPEMRYKSAYWDDEMLDALGMEGLPPILPPFIAPTDMVGTLTDEAAAELGLPAMIPVFCTGPDFIAAMIGTASLEEGKMYDCAGSSEGVNLVVSDKYLADRKPSLSSALRVLPSVVPGLWNIAVLIPESGSIFVNYRRIAEAVLGRDVPYSELIDSSLDNKDSDGYEILEYIAQNFSDAVDKLLRLIEKDNAGEGMTRGHPVITVTGGQAQNTRWMQLKCDKAGVPLAVMKCPDAELIGDAAAAWTGLGVYPSLQDAARAMCAITAD